MFKQVVSLHLKGQLKIKRNKRLHLLFEVVWLSG